MRTPEDEALVSFASEEPIATDAVEQAIESKSAGTEHDYRVLGDRGDRIARGLRDGRHVQRPAAIARG